MEAPVIFVTHLRAWYTVLSYVNDLCNLRMGKGQVHEVKYSNSLRCALLRCGFPFRIILIIR